MHLYKIEYRIRYGNHKWTRHSRNCIAKTEANAKENTMKWLKKQYLFNESFQAEVL